MQLCCKKLSLMRTNERMKRWSLSKCTKSTTKLFQFSSSLQWNELRVEMMKIHCYFVASNSHGLIAPFYATIKLHCKAWRWSYDGGASMYISFCCRWISKLFSAIAHICAKHWHENWRAETITCFSVDSEQSRAFK